MTPADETTDLDAKDRNDFEAQRAKRIQNAALITKRMAAAEKWRIDNQKNALLFPQSYDFS